MINCFISQQSEMDLPFSEDDLKKTVQTILGHDLFRAVPDASFISLVFVDDSEMKHLNHHYRMKDKTTDVLSFVIEENTQQGFLLGELVISLPKATKDALEFGISLKDEIIRLIVHGFVHLMGHDHITPEQENEMSKVECSLFRLYRPTEDCCFYG